jgi:hypothetical protein
MLAWLSAFKLSRPVILGIVIAGLLAVAGLGAWRAASDLRAALTGAHAAGKAEADAQWRAQIAESNAKVAQAQVAQAVAVAAAEARAAQDRAAREEALTLMEKANAALPAGNACGLDRDRVRLLRGTPARP